MRRICIPNMPYELCTRVAEGLPLVPSHNLNFILWGILSKAQQRHKLHVCHMLFMGNHIHLIVVSENPEEIARFMHYLKTESAHAINRYLGKRGVSVWEEGYSSTLIMDTDKLLERIRYIYNNPTEAGLVRAISDYPGINSYAMLCSGAYKKRAKKVPRDSIYPLTQGSLSVREQKELTTIYERGTGEKVDFILSPLKALECFIADKIEIEKAHQHIIAIVQEDELIRKRNFERQGTKVIGATALKRGSMFQSWTPKKREKSVICMSSCKEKRRQFIDFYKHQCELARQAYESWKAGNFNARVPPGMYHPSLPWHGCLVPWAIGIGLPPNDR